MKCPSCGFKNSEGMNFCGKCGTKLVTTQIEQRKFATVIYADLKGYTTLSEKKDPEEISDILKKLFKQFEAVFDKYNAGYRDFIGDAVLALFGIPISYGNDAENAAHVALALQQEIKKYSEEIDLKLEMRIGINSGEVVYSEIVPVKKTVTGDTINTAQRLETAAEPGTILISKSSARLIEGQFYMEPLAPLKLKGKTEKIIAFRLIKPKKTEAAFYLPIVNREKELAALKDIFTKIKEKRKPSFVMLAGEIGIGKSKLLLEFLNYIDKEKCAKYFVCNSIQTGGGIYHPITDLLKFLLDAGGTDSSEKLKENILDASRRLLPKDNIAHHFLGFFFDLKYPDSPLGHLSPEQTRLSAFATLKNFIESYIKETPFILVIEDIQYSDRGTKDFFEFLTQVQFRGPIMILNTGWKESFISEIIEQKRKSWRSWELIELKSLDETASTELIKKILKNKNSPKGLIDILLKRGEGNPLFFSEFIKELQEQEILVEKEKDFVLTAPLRKILLPNNLRTLLESRVDRLPESQRELLKHVAVIGTAFWYSFARSLVKGNIDNDIRHLKEKGYIYEHKPSRIKNDFEYFFQHNLLREVAYKILLKKVRKDLHRKILHRLNTDYKKRRLSKDLYLQLGAMHSEGAEEYETALDFYERLGNEMESRYAITDAHASFTKAIDIMNTHLMEQIEERKGKIIKKRAELSQFLCLHDDAIKDFEYLITLDMPKIKITGYLGLADVYKRKGDFDKSIECSLKARDIAEKENMERFQAQALNSCGLAYWRKCSYKKALKLIEDAIEIFTKLISEKPDGLTAEDIRDMNKGIGSCYNSMGTIYQGLGNYAAAQKAYKQSLSIYEKIDRIQETAAIISNIGAVYYGQGEYDKALKYHKESLQIRAKIGDMHGIAISQNNIAIIYSFLGDYDSALELFQKSLEKIREIGEVTGAGLILNNIGHVHLDMGNYRQALKTFEQSLATQQESENKHVMTTSFNGISKVHRYFGNLDKAIQFQDKTEKMARNINARELIAQSLNVKGEIFLEMADFDAAIASLKESLEICEEATLKSDLPSTLTLLAQAIMRKSSEKKNRKEAEKYLKEALKTAQNSKEKKAICTALLGYIELHHLQKQYKKAKKICNDLLTTVENKNLQNLFPEVLFLKGENLIALGEEKAAFLYFEKSLELAKQQGQKRLIIKIKNFL